MTVLDWLRGGSVAHMQETPAVDPDMAALNAQVAHLEESLADLARDDLGWNRLDGTNPTSLSRDQLTQMSAAARLAWIANPLIQRAVNVRMFYTWGQGVQIAARDDTVNQVVQAFLDDELNQLALFGHDARQDKDRALQLDGNLMFALFTNPRTGAVQVRSIPWSEIQRVITDPEDKTQRHYYLRQWQAVVVDPVTGTAASTRLRAFYPELGYRPAMRPRNLEGVEVRWDSPIVHMRAGGLDGQDFGLSEVYSALAWARAYKSFLEDWASLARSLSRFAWKGKTKTSRVGALRESLEQPGLRDGVLPPPLPIRRDQAGQTFASDEYTDLAPIAKTGATLDADSGRPLAMMVAAAMDVPYTILMGDADMGNLATAKTLDRPTELAMESRRESWAAVIRRICGYVVDQAVKAPAGQLRGTVARNDFDREVITLAAGLDRTVEVTWPSILEHDLLQLVTAIVEADGTGRVPPEIICRLLLTALDVDDVDEVMAELLDADGNFKDPAMAAQAAAAAAQASAGQQAVDAFRRGEDPAAVVR